MAIQRRPWHTLLDKDHRGLIPEEYVRYGLRSAVKVLHGMITSKSCETSEELRLMMYRCMIKVNTNLVQVIILCWNVKVISHQYRPMIINHQLTIRQHQRHQNLPNIDERSSSRNSIATRIQFQRKRRTWSYTVTNQTRRHGNEEVVKRCRQTRNTLLN